MEQNELENGTRAALVSVVTRGESEEAARVSLAELGKLLETAGGVPVLTLDCGPLNEHSVGALLYFFELACGISAYVLGVNPFNQPGVEAYKKNMYHLLGKPGY